MHTNRPTSDDVKILRMVRCCRHNAYYTIFRITVYLPSVSSGAICSTPVSLGCAISYPRDDQQLLYYALSIADIHLEIVVHVCQVF